MAQRFGSEVEAVGLLAALSRAIGLWEPSALSAAGPPGSLAVGELGAALFGAWRAGGAWDEARADAEVLRLTPDARDAGPSAAVREMVLDALRALGEGRWMRWSALAGYLTADARTPGLTRLLRRWGGRVGVEPPELLQVARRIATESLHTLGVIDLGGDGDDAEGDEGGPALRLTPRGRLLVAELPPRGEPSPSGFVDAQALRIGAAARVAHVLALGPMAEIGRVAEQLDLIVSPQALARAVSAGVEGNAIQARIEALAPLPERLSHLLRQASVVLGRVTHVSASGFLWVEDEELRGLLLTRRTTADLFLDPSPPQGLLLVPDVDLERVVRRCRAVGIEIEVDGGALRARPGTEGPASECGKGPASSRMRRSATDVKSRR